MQVLQLSHFSTKGLTDVTVSGVGYHHTAHHHVGSQDYLATQDPVARTRGCTGGERAD
jgi:hypothetical protein